MWHYSKIIIFSKLRPQAFNIIVLKQKTKRSITISYANSKRSHSIEKPN